MGASIARHEDGVDPQDLGETDTRECNLCGRSFSLWSCGLSWYRRITALAETNGSFQFFDKWPFHDLERSESFSFAKNPETLLDEIAI